MTPDDFSFLARMLRRRSGLSLTPSKIELVERRLSAVMRRFGFRDLSGLVKELRLGREALAVAVTDAVTVNETSFFRDADVFARFENWLLPKMLSQRGQDKRLRIWSAACAAGQEAYSIAMILDAAGLALQGWTVDLIATDLSREAISRAEEGRYDALEMARGLNDEQRERWFRPSGEHWCVVEPLRRMIDFHVFNLLDSYGWLDDLDFVFCRNVLIYFDRAHKLSVLDRIAETLSFDGALLLGEAETPEAFTGAFVEAPCGGGIYFKNPAPLARVAAR